MATKGKPLGPRVTVKFGKVKVKNETKEAYVYMRKATAELFGFAFEEKIKIRIGKNKQRVPIKGSVGAGSIKVYTGKKTTKGHRQIARIPVPGNATILEIQNFLKTAKKNKPENFFSVDGQSWPVSNK